MASGTLPVIRREQILTAIRNRSFARVAELSDEFGISEVTVRSDLDALQRSGVVRRVHGGAILGGRHVRAERPFEEEATASAEEKAAIAAVAAGVVCSGDTIILDVGTTCTAVAGALVDSDLEDIVVITNGLNIAFAFEATMPRFTVVVTGGTVRPLQHSLVDPFGSLVLEQLNADVMFLGCNGVDAGRGVTNVNLPEANMKQRMMRSAQRTVAVADGSKIGQVSAARICGVADLAMLVTGSSAPAALLDELEQQGLDIRIAH